MKPKLIPIKDDGGNEYLMALNVKTKFYCYKPVTIKIDGEIRRILVRKERRSP